MTWPRRKNKPSRDFPSHNGFDRLDRSYLNLYSPGEFPVTVIHPLEPSNGIQWRTVARRCLRWIIRVLRGRTGEAKAPRPKQRPQLRLNADWMPIGNPNEYRVHIIILLVIIKICHCPRTNAALDREVMQMAPSGNVFLHATRRKALIVCNPTGEANCNYCCRHRSRKWPSCSAAMTLHQACSTVLTRRRMTIVAVPRKDGLTLRDRIVHLKWVMSGGTFVLPFTVSLTNGHAPSRQDVFVQEDVWVLRRIHLLISAVSHPMHYAGFSVVVVAIFLGLHQEGTHSISGGRRKKGFLVFTGLPPN